MEFYLGQPVKVMTSDGTGVGYLGRFIGIAETDAGTRIMIEPFDDGLDDVMYANPRVVAEA